jgi:hypothetical protein
MFAKVFLLKNLSTCSVAQCNHEALFYMMGGDLSSPNLRRSGIMA